MPHRVLLVEDEVDIAKLLSMRFRAAGFEVRHAVDAIIGMREVRTAPPDVIVLDLMLPGGGGLTVLRQLRRLVQSSHIPVIVYTGMEDESHKCQVEGLDVQAYFQKPLEPQHIVQKALELLGGNAPVTKPGA
jgi:DNA-binding response OmpR family regulator